MKTSLILVASLGLAFTACKKETDEEKMAKALKGAMGDLAKAGGSAKAAPAPAAAPKLDLAEITLDAWGLKVQAPKGATFGATEAPNKDLEMPGSTTITTTSACGVDVEIYSHPKATLGEHYNAAKDTDGLKGVSFMVDEKTDAGFKTHFTGKAPIGPMYGASTGTVIGDRVMLCSSGLNRMTASEAACVYAVCSTIAAK